MAKWALDTTHSNVEFVVKHMMVTNVRGRFEDFSAEIEFDAANPAATVVNAAIKTASVNTGVADRDNHLRSADFFNSEQYPDMSFRSTRVEVKDEENAVLYGDLTIAGTTHPVSMNVEVTGTGTNPWGKTVAGFAASTKINREDFGLTWNVALEAGGILVSKEVKINLELQAVLVEEVQPA